MLIHWLLPLPYPFNALEPHIDALTMEIHHDRHHQAYITNYVKLLEGTGLLDKYDPEELLQHLDEVPADKKQGVINNLGGHWNHSFFWTILCPHCEWAPEGWLLNAINDEWKTFDNFKKEFTQAALSVFGSGWAWLVMTPNGHLSIRQTAGQETPLSHHEKPILGIDVWEHAYYLKHQNKRADYITAFWNVVNWKQVQTYFKGKN